MKKYYIFFFIFFIACQQQHTDVRKQISSNLLLDTDVPVYSLYSEFIQQQLPWKNKFKIRSFITNLFYRVLQNKLLLYNPIFEDTVFYPLNKDVWLTILKNDKNLTFDTTEFNDLFFFEYWYLDTIDDFNIEKKILYWSPVKREKNVLKLAGKIKSDRISKKRILAQQIIYEFSLQDTLYINDRLNKKKLIRILIDWAIHHPEKAFNPFTATPMSKQELYHRLSLSDSSLYMPYNDINSLLFVENWYYDTVHYSIEKEVLSVAPILYSFDEGEISKNILFVLHLKQKPIKLL